MRNRTRKKREELRKKRKPKKSKDNDIPAMNCPACKGSYHD